MKLRQLSYIEAAIKQLTAHFYGHLNRKGNRNQIVFEAPTGAGKTIATAQLLKFIVNDLPNRFEIQYRNLAFIWIAPNQLQIQSYDRLKGFYEETRDLRPVKFEDITDNRLHTNEILFLNWQSISREENVYIRPNESDKDFYTYLANTVNDGIQLVVIIDEEHLMATFGEKANIVLNNINAKIELRISATPITKIPYWVKIDRTDVVQAEMIKKGVQLNPKIKADEQAGRDVETVLLEKALAKRLDLLQAYQAEGSNINPLLLIQLPSDKKQISVDDTRIKSKIVTYLNANHAINEENKNLAIWLSGEYSNLESISEPDNSVEVMLFKQAISLGWDCPRAAVLLIYRELHTETFTVQTVGRILRMPEQKHYTNDELNYGYVYTNLNKDLITILPEEADYITENKAFRSKSLYSDFSLKSYQIKREFERNRIGKDFKKALYTVAEKKYGLQLDPTTPEITAPGNRRKLNAHFIETDVTHIDIPIPANVSFDGDKSEAIRVDKIEHFAKTPYQLLKLFERFCYNNCGDYQPDGSHERVRLHLKYLFQEYLNFFGQDTYKIVLYNQQQFVDLLNEARAEYAKTMAAKKKEEIKIIVNPAWKVPEYDIFNHRYTEFPDEKHVLQPLFLYKNEFGSLGDSANEFNFINFLKQNNQTIKWWYKNGSKGEKYFAIHYKTQDGKDSLFYIDFIILFQNGCVGLFDTKTQNSDYFAVQKHNALVEYIEQRNKTIRKTIGGILIPKDGSWWFCRNRIDNTNNLTGWEVFNPATI